MFIAHITQEGEGCGYTIGCGQDLLELKASSYDEAIEELKKEVVGMWDPEFEEFDEGYWDERRLEKVRLIEIGIIDQEVPIEQWYADAEREARCAKDTEVVRTEKKEYLRLRAKYGQSAQCNE